MSEPEPTGLPDDLETALAENDDELVHLLNELDTVGQTVDLLSFAAEALDDEMVVMLARTADQLGELADTASEPETVQGLQSMLVAVGDAADEPPERVGTLGLLRSLRDPEVQLGLGFILAIARALGQELNRREEV